MSMRQFCDVDCNKADCLHMSTRVRARRPVVERQKTPSAQLAKDELPEPEMPTKRGPPRKPSKKTTVSRKKPSPKAVRIKKTSPKKQVAPDKQTLMKVWTRAAMRGGFTAVPDGLIAHMSDINMTISQFATLMVVCKFAWSKRTSHPSHQAIADCLGTDKRTAQRNLLELEKRGFIKKKMRHHERGGRSSNEYDFSPLLEFLVQPALEEEARREGRGLPVKEASMRVQAACRKIRARRKIEKEQEEGQ